MRKSRFSEEQIIAVLTEQERGMSTAEVCRRHGISQTKFYKWKAKYGGMDVSEARRMKTLEAENARLKKLLADTMLDNAVLKDLLGKPWRRPSRSGLRRSRRCRPTTSPSAVPADWSASMRRPSGADGHRTTQRSGRACGRSPATADASAIAGSA